MDLDFIIKNWYLFAALVVIIALIALDPLRRKASGVQSVSAAQVPQLVNHESAVVIDVSSPSEYKEGHIPNAISVPVAELDKNLKRLQKYKDKPVVLSCRSGNRANKAAAVLRRNEFTRLYVLSGGLLSWQKENLPIEK
jgi:rhodanese-related sulfurtransferase